MLVIIIKNIVDIILNITYVVSIFFHYLSIHSYDVIMLGKLVITIFIIIPILLHIYSEDKSCCLRMSFNSFFRNWRKIRVCVCV